MDDETPRRFFISNGTFAIGRADKFEIYLVKLERRETLRLFWNTEIFLFPSSFIITSIARADIDLDYSRGIE